MPGSEVNIRKMIQMQRDSYQVPDGEEWRITVSELIANSLDSEAKWIKIFLEEGDERGYFNIICEDNGIGMDKENFKKYHDIYTITKSRRSGTIGFAGIGAKLTLDLCEKVVTETKSDQGDFYHSDWYFANGTDLSSVRECPECKESINSEIPHYHILNDVYKMDNVGREMDEHTGTYVKVLNLKTKNLDLNSLRKYIIAEYQYSIILKNVRIYVNDEELKPLIPQGTEIENEYNYQRSYPVKEKLGPNELTLLGKFYNVNDEFKDRVNSENPEEINYGFDIVVYGKRIARYTFGIEKMMKGADSQYVYGYIECDQLIDIVEPSKDSFNLKSGLWKFFEAKVTEDIRKWLKDIGKFNEEFWKNEEVPKSKEIIKFLNVLQTDFSQLIEDFFGKGKSGASGGGGSKDIPTRVEGNIHLLDPNGEIPGSPTDEGTLTEGTRGGGGISDGPSFPSDLKGSGPGVTPNESGTINLSKKNYGQRKPRLNIYIYPMDTREAVSWDPTRYAFIINENHPGYIYSEQTAPKGTNIYIINTIIDFIIRQREDLSNNEEQRKDIVYDLYNTLLSGNKKSVIE